MLPRPRGPGSAGGLRGGGLGLGQVDLGGDRLAAGLGHEGGGLGGGEIALAGLLGRVGGHGQADEGLGGAGIGRGRVLPGGRGVGVIAQRGVGIAGEDGEIVAGVLGQAEVLLPGHHGLGQLLLARGRVGAGVLVKAASAGGVLVAGGFQSGPGGGVVGVLLGLLERVLLRRVDELALVGASATEGVEEAAVAAAGADPEEDKAAPDEDGEAEVHRLDGAATAAAAQIEEHQGVSDSTTYSESPKSGGPTVISSAAARLASRRSANLSNTMLARKRTTIGAVSRPVVTGSAPGIAAAMMAMITVA